MQIQKTSSVNFGAGLIPARNLTAKAYGSEIKRFIRELSNVLAPEKGCDVVELSAKEGRRILLTEDGRIQSLGDKKMLESTGTKFEQTRNNLEVVVKKGKDAITGITSIDLKTPEKMAQSIRRVVEMVQELI